LLSGAAQWVYGSAHQTRLQVQWLSSPKHHAAKLGTTFEVVSHATSYRFFRKLLNLP
jgi:hypothetical protein